MFRYVIKLTGLVFLVLAVITAILDLTRTIANSTLTTTALGLEWFNFHSASLNNFQVGIERHLGAPWLWSNVIHMWTPRIGKTFFDVLIGCFHMSGLLMRYLIDRWP